MRFLARFALVLSLAALLPAQEPAPGVRELTGLVQPSRLSRTVDRLASFGTRHTLSDPLSERRGIGAAGRWLDGEFQALSRLPGSRLVPFDDPFHAEPGPLLPEGANLVNRGLLLPGTDPARAKQALVLVAHYDSLGRDPKDAAGDAPGAVDNASGVALVLETATVLAATTPAVSVYFVATAGGAQGLLGSARLASRLQAEGIDIVGMVAADCVGNTLTADGRKVGGAMRLFSEGVPDQETEGQKRVRELLGTENDGASRELARYLKRAGERFVDGLDCLVMLRRDRLGRDGEQTVFTRKGYPGVRVTELTDPYERLAPDPRPGTGKRASDTPALFDAGYCARITRMVVAGVRLFSYAPAAPQNVGLGGAGTSDARLWWTLPADSRIAGIVLYRRRADGVQWQETRGIAKSESQVIPGTGTDLDAFAVASVDTQGEESLPVSPRSLAF